MKIRLAGRAVALTPACAAASLLTLGWAGRPGMAQTPSAMTGFALTRRDVVDTCGGALTQGWT